MAAQSRRGQKTGLGGVAQLDSQCEPLPEGPSLPGETAETHLEHPDLVRCAQGGRLQTATRGWKVYQKAIKRPCRARRAGSFKFGNHLAPQNPKEAQAAREQDPRETGLAPQSPERETFEGGSSLDAS